MPKLIMADVFDMIGNVGWWMDPKIWLIGALLIVIITILGIYFKVFQGEKRP